MTVKATTLVGAIGEKAVAEYLESLGMKILARNWRTSAGELDLVVCDGTVIAAVEVKTRSGTGFGHPLEAITRQKVLRLQKLLRLYIASSGLRGFSGLRIDAAGVELDKAGKVSIDYLQGACDG